MPPLDHALVHRLSGGAAGALGLGQWRHRGPRRRRGRISARLDGVMIGRAAYHDPAGVLGAADALITGARPAPRWRRSEAVRAMLPHIEAELARRAQRLQSDHAAHARCLQRGGRGRGAGARRLVRGGLPSRAPGRSWSRRRSRTSPRWRHERGGGPGGRLLPPRLDSVSTRTRRLARWSAAARPVAEAICSPTPRAPRGDLALRRHLVRGRQHLPQRPGRRGAGRGACPRSAAPRMRFRGGGARPLGLRLGPGAALGLLSRAIRGRGRRRARPTTATA